MVAKLDELRASHQIELAELVRAVQHHFSLLNCVSISVLQSNKKYSELLNDKLTREEELASDNSAQRLVVSQLQADIQRVSVSSDLFAFFSSSCSSFQGPTWGLSK